MRDVATTSLVRLGANHPERGGGCRMVAVSRKACCNSKPTHILLGLDLPSGLKAPMNEAPLSKSVSRSLGVEGQHRPMYSDCISCTLQFANLGLVRLKTTRQFIHSTP